MTPPTRAQITAPLTQPTYQVRIWVSGGWQALSVSDIQQVDIQHTTSDDLHGVAFGASVGAEGSVVVADTPTLRAYTWQLMPIRVDFGFATSDRVQAFVGIVTAMQRDGVTMTWTCRGLDELMRGTPVYTPMIAGHLAATQTTVTSAELTSGGIINVILWTCGGRPLEQQATYPSAVFYYTCHNALIAPAWAWVAGENAWDELQRCCKAVGGQIIQRPDGVIAYVNPLYFGAMSGTPFTFGGATFATVSLQGEARDIVASVRMRVTIRRMQGEQTVYEDTTARYVAANSTISVVCDLPVPVYDYVYAASGAPTLPSTGIVATDIWGVRATPAATLTQSAAARATIHIANTSSTPLIVSRLALRGRPVEAASDEQAIIGSGMPQLELGDAAEALVQSSAHAAMLGALYTSFYGVPRPIITLHTCGYDPDRIVGERCVLHDPDAGFTNEPVRIVAIRVHETGATMDVDVVSVAGLPTLDQFFVVDGVYTDTDQRYLGY